MRLPSLRKWHHWLGWGLGWLMLIWFVSGTVMIYARAPLQYRSPESRPAQGWVLDEKATRLSLEQAWIAAGHPPDPVEIRMGSLAGRPAFFFQTRDGRYQVVRADSGRLLGEIDRTLALSVARHTLGNTAALDYHGQVTLDQWTVGALARAGLGPFHHFTTQDCGGTEIYISSRTGEVCQLTTGGQRFWSWMGTIPHWLYFTFLRQHKEFWRWTIIALSAVGCILCLTGLWQGVRFFRPRGYGKGRHHRLSAFVGLRKWHHYLGLVFGLPTLAWTFSGMMSLSPFDWGPPAHSHRDLAEAFSGGPVKPSQCKLPPAALLGALDGDFSPKMLRVVNFQGRPYYLALDDAGGSRLAPAWESAPRVMESLSTKELIAAARDLLPDQAMVSADLLSQGGLYLAGWRKPVLKATYDDPGETWIFIDPARAAIIRCLDGSARLDRWLYRFLHTWDLPWLLRNEWVRQALMLVLLAGGLLLCLTGPLSRLTRRRRL